MKRQLIKKDKEITTKHMKICSTLYGIKELQIKTCYVTTYFLDYLTPLPPNKN